MIEGALEICSFSCQINCASNIGFKFDMQIQHVLDMFALYSYLLKYYREKWWEQSSRTVNSFVWIVCRAMWLGEQLGFLVSLMVPTVGFVWVFPCQAVPSELSPPPLDSVQGIRLSVLWQCKKITVCQCVHLLPYLKNCLKVVVSREFALPTTWSSPKWFRPLWNLEYKKSLGLTIRLHVTHFSSQNITTLKVQERNFVRKL